MLVLSRKRREAIVVLGPGGRALVKVTVVEIRGQVVKLSFEADAGVPVHRLEVWEQILGARGPDSPPPFEAGEMA
jgi:carbon storage regulator CsrA